MNKLYAKSNSIHITNGKNDRILAIFPHPAVAQRSIAWCRKQDLSVIDSILALLHQCKMNGATTFGRKFGDIWGTIAGEQPYKVGLQNLSPSK